MSRDLSLWWRQLHAVVEFKRDEDFNDAIRQLCRYMRQMLREQPDRRFVLGITICFDKLGVWLCDRSGVIGIDTPINIHNVSVILIYLTIVPHISFRNPNSSFM